MEESKTDRNGRKAVTFNIKEELIREFAEICEKKGMIMSRRVEKCIEEDIERIRRIEE